MRGEYARKLHIHEGGRMVLAEDVLFTLSVIFISSLIFRTTASGKRKEPSSPLQHPKSAYLRSVILAFIKK
jgi:hypothetical protein